MKTIIDLYGFFGTIAGYWGRNEQTVPPWSDTALEISPDKIDKLFFTRYGDRPISKYVAEYLKLSGGESLTDEAEMIISDYVLDMFRAQWSRLTADFTAEYNPIENYNLVESETEDIETGGTDTSTEGFTNYKETQKMGHTVSTENAGNLYGFNSNSPVGSDTGDSTTTFGALTDSGDTKEIEGTRDYQTDYGKTEGKTRALNRHGNIGTLTNVKMLTEDTEFWTANNFYEKIAADMASILTIPIYE